MTDKKVTAGPQTVFGRLLLNAIAIVIISGITSLAVIGTVIHHLDGRLIKPEQFVPAGMCDSKGIQSDEYTRRIQQEEVTKFFAGLFPPGTSVPLVDVIMNQSQFYFQHFTRDQVPNGLTTLSSLAAGVGDYGFLTSCGLHLWEIGFLAQYDSHGKILSVEGTIHNITSLP